MPDKDIFDRTFAPGWANPARKINKIGDPKIAAHATARALRKDLHAMGGLRDSKKLYVLLLASQNGSFSRRIRRKQQCGLCTSCLLRRLSLIAADLVDADLPDDYQFDILKASSIENANRLFQFKAMRNQIQKLRTCLEAQNPWFELSHSYPILEEIKLNLGNLSKDNAELIQNKILYLYSNYVREWSIFESRIN
jgi:hypothetical protein